MIRERTFAEALEHRRSYYSISNDSPVLDEEIVHIIRTAVNMCLRHLIRRPHELCCCWVMNTRNYGEL